MAFITKQPNGRWRARYRGPDNRARSKTFDRKADTQRFLSLTVADIQRAAWVDPARGRKALAEWAEEWIAMSVHLRPSTRSTTRASCMPGSCRPSVQCHWRPSPPRRCGAGWPSRPPRA